MPAFRRALRASVIRLRLRRALAAISVVTPRRALPLALVLAILFGTVLGVAASSYSPDDRIIVGATGGSLSVVMALDDALVVVGGGDSRSDLVDLVDRSVLPWRRHVSLLVVPGGDRQNAAGALGLIARGGVQTVAVIGIPAPEPIWDLLDQQATTLGTEVRYLQGTNRVRLSATTELLLIATKDDGATGNAISSVALRHGGVRLLVQDAPRSVPEVTEPISDGFDEPTVLISLRAGARTQALSPTLVVRPEPGSADEAEQVGGRYVASVDRGERLTLRLSSDEVRVSLDQVTPVASAPPP